MALSPKEKIRARERRKKRIRKKIEGTYDKPRLCVYKSNRYIYAQLVDDIRGVTVASASSIKYKEKDKQNCKSAGVARKIGQDLGKIIADKGIKRLVLDRSGYPYHGIVKALAEGIREKEIEF
ncbi:50S ribosomal protein L18 [Candidatus Aerophobetes bacterium]|nr:50S ribosomal protein L18 [Candidatus Aerophobetes bacterium]